MSLSKKIDVVVEVPYKSNLKYEMDNGKLRLDRILSCSMCYPGNYGFIENTLAEDGDTLDALIMTNYDILPGTVVECKVLGALIMTDEKGLDEKIIVVPSDNVDTAYSHLNELNDLGEDKLEKIKHFFENYKTIDKDKWVKVNDFIDSEHAINLIDKYKKNFN
jgi:inorganic pyrophosphatase